MSDSTQEGRLTGITATPGRGTDTDEVLARVPAGQVPTRIRPVPREPREPGTPGGVVRVSPARLDWLEALVEGDRVFTERFGIAVEAGWAGFPEALPATVERTRRHPEDRWGSQLFFDDESLVGLGGFYGPPVEGRVEIGYAVAPSRQGRGIATAAVEILLGRAVEAGVSVVLAHTLAGVNGSTVVLGRTGFVRTSVSIDPDLGDVWRWERPLTDRGGRPDTCTTDGPHC